MNEGEDIRAPLPRFGQKQRRLIATTDTWRLISDGGNLLLEGPRSLAITSRQLSPNEVGDYSLRDGSWPFGLEEQPNGALRIYWLYPFETNVHFWVCEKGERIVVGDIAASELQSFLRQRSIDNPTLLAKLALAGAPLSMAERALMSGSDCLEALYACLGMALAEPDSLGAIESIAAKITSTLKEIDWAAVDFNLAAVRRRLVPLMSAIARLDEIHSGIFDSRLAAWAATCRSVLGQTDFADYAMLRDITLSSLSKIPQRRFSSGGALDKIKGRLIQITFRLGKEAGANLAVQDVGRLKQARMAGSTLYAYNLAHGYMLAPAAADYARRLNLTTDADMVVDFQAADTPLDVRSVAFQTHASFSHIRLIPDVYFFISHGYKHFKATLAGRAADWSAKAPVAFWRGTTTGWEYPLGADFDSVMDGMRKSPRFRLCKISADHANVMDAKFTDVVQAPGQDEKTRVADALKSERLIGARYSQYDFIKFKYQIDVDGNANSWSLFNKLLMGCCVLKIASPWSQWYYGELKPWTHYVPVAEDLSDLLDKLEWCRSHDDQARSIGEAGKSFAEALTFEQEMTKAAFAALDVARAHAG